MAAANQQRVRRKADLNVQHCHILSYSIGPHSFGEEVLLLASISEGGFIVEIHPIRPFATHAEELPREVRMNPVPNVFVDQIMLSRPLPVRGEAA